MLQQLPLCLGLRFWDRRWVVLLDVAGASLLRGLTWYDVAGTVAGVNLLGATFFGAFLG